MENLKSTHREEAKGIDPGHIFEIGTGFFAAKVLLTAVKLELFTVLATQSLTGKEIKQRLGLHERGLYDFLDSLVALGFLQRRGIKDSSVYSNSPDSEMFLDKCKLSYIGGILEMANNRLYPFWNFLEEALRTGIPQNEIRMGRLNLFDEIYTDKNKTREFINAMGGAQSGVFKAFAELFDFSQYKTLCDIGGAGAQLSAFVYMNNQHIKCTSFDLPVVAPIALENISKLGIADKIEIKSGDFFNDQFPSADIITMSKILHDWGTNDKIKLIKKAYEALPSGGLLIVLEDVIDEERRANIRGLLMSLNMLIETPEGYDFTAGEFENWAINAGFKSIKTLPLTNSTSALIATR